MNFILVSNISCTFIDWDGAIENCKTYDSDFKGYTPSSGTWSIPSGTITAGVIAGYTFVGWYTITSGTYGTVDSATRQITRSRNISYSQISSAGTYGISGLAFVCAKYQENPKFNIASDVPGVFTLSSGGTKYHFNVRSSTYGFYTNNVNLLNNFTIVPTSSYSLSFTPDESTYTVEGFYTVQSGSTSGSPWSFFYPANATKKIAGSSWTGTGSALSSTCPNCIADYGTSKQNIRVIRIKTIGKELICTYNPNGGFCDRYFDRVRFGGVFPALPTATWYSDTTNRWYTAITGGTEIHQGDTVTQTEDFTLYAHWDRTETCTVTFNAGGGTASETQRTVNKGAVIGALPTATWTGHTFNGWFLSSGGGTAITSTYVVDDDLYLYAQWDSNTYTVTFNGNGGTPSQSAKSVAYGSQYGTLPYCDQTGKTFLGWFTSASGGTKVEATTIFNQQSDQTLYAHWSDVDPAVKWYYLVSP